MKKKWITRLCAVFLSLILCISPILAGAGFRGTSAYVIDVLDYGADPTGMQDSTEAIWNAFEAAKEKSNHGRNQVTVNFPTGEYHIYKDKAQTREYHTSNTNSAEHPIKTIGLLIEDQNNLVVEGNGSLFMMHGNIMALAVVRSKNITLQNFSWDFAVPTVSEMTVLDMGTIDGKEYTDFYIPACFPYEIKGTTIQWSSDLSPYTNEPYWTEEGVHNGYCIVGYVPEEGMSRRYDTGGDSPFFGVSSIARINEDDKTKVRIIYHAKRPAMQRKGMVLEFASSYVRETAGAFTWESENVTADHVNVHFMHGFGWLIQMSKDVYYKSCNLMPRKDSGHTTVSFADGIHASGAAGEIVIEDCNFSHTHDDPINIHGTFTRVEERVDSNTLVLKYIHSQQGGFPQYHVGDKVRFFTRDYLSSTDGETEYTVAEIISNPGEQGNDMRTMRIRFEENLPENLSEQIGGEPKYVAENVTYSPEVSIRNNTFKNIATRGILCTTGQKVVIENNDFSPTTMATIFLSNDSNEWYESGPIRDMTIRGNTFAVKTIGGREGWQYAPAIFVHPVTKGNRLPSADDPIHKNIKIEDNVFFMDLDSVVRAESVENLTFRNNKVFRMEPNVNIQLDLPESPITVGAATKLGIEITGKQNNGKIDHLFDLTKCKNVIIENNTYDDGLKKYIVTDDASKDTIQNHDADIQIVQDTSLPASAAASNLHFVSSNPEVAFVDQDGNLTAKSAGSTEILAYYEWNDTIIKSNRLTVQVGDTETAALEIKTPKSEIKVGETTRFSVAGDVNDIVWSVSSFENDSNTDIAQITEDGQLTANKNGIIWVKASAGNAEGTVPVVIYGEQQKKINEKLSIQNEDKNHYSIDGESIGIQMQRGDLYQDNNSVRNLFLYEVENQEDFRVVVKATGLPIRENDQWDTGSFLIYQDSDNYISLGKKSHKKGFATVLEQAGSAEEFEDQEKDNDVTEAYLGITKQGQTVTLDAKPVGGEWKEIKKFDQDFSLENVKIGFAAWCSSDRAKEISFSEFHIGDADASYDDLLDTPEVSFSEMIENDRAQVSDVQISNTDAMVEVTYQFEDGDDEGESYFLWSWEENGKVIHKVTKTPRIVTHAAEITCKVFPVDRAGQPGVPSEEIVYHPNLADSEGLNSIYVNAHEVYKNGDPRLFSVKVPEDEMLVLGYVAANNENEAVQVVRNSELIAETSKSTDQIGVKVENGDTIYVRKGKSEYVIDVQTVGSNQAALKSVVSQALNINASELGEGHLTVSTDSRNADFELTISPETAELQLLQSDYRIPVRTTRDGFTHQANVNLSNGLNSFYVKAIAADGISNQTFVINVIYTPKDGRVAPQVTVTFYKDRDTQMDSFKVDRGSRLEKSVVNTPYQSGYRFIGWVTENGKVFDFDQPIFIDTAVYAQWEKRYNGGGGSGSDSEEKSNDPKPESEPSISKVEMIPTTQGDPERVKDYMDVNAHWAKDAIAWTVTNRLFAGVSNTQFAPDIAMTRGMLVTVLHRLAGQPGIGENSFTDVPEDAYYKNAVAWANQMKLVTGVGNSLFAPNNNITREQLAVILYKFAGSPAVQEHAVAFADAGNVSSWAKDAVAWAVHEGLLSGMTDGSLVPGGQATRAQVATILMRFEEKNRNAKLS